MSNILPQEAADRATIINELSAAISRLKKRIEALHLEANNIVINPFNLRLVATASDGSYFVAVKGEEVEGRKTISFRLAPLARVGDIISFQHNEEHYLAKLESQFAAQPADQRLSNFKLVTLREFSATLEEILKKALDETTELLQTIEADTNNQTEAYGNTN